MINSVCLVGRMTDNAELRYTPNNQAVAAFRLAVNLANWAKKGALIGITGRIQTRNFENQQGQRVYVTEVVADGFQLLEFNKQNNQGQSQGHDTPDFSRQAEPFSIDDDSLPF